MHTPWSRRPLLWGTGTLGTAAITSGAGTAAAPFTAVFRGNLGRNEWSVTGLAGVHATHGMGLSRAAPDGLPLVVTGRPQGLANLSAAGGAAASLRFQQTPWYATGIGTRVRVFNGVSGADETQGASAADPGLGALMPNPGGSDTLARDVAAGGNTYVATVRVGAGGAATPVPRSGRWKFQIAMVSRPGGAPLRPSGCLAACLPGYLPRGARPAHLYRAPLPRRPCAEEPQRPERVVCHDRSG